MLPLSRCVTPGELLNLSVPQCLVHMMGGNNNPYLVALLVCLVPGTQEVLY